MMYATVYFLCKKCKELSERTEGILPDDTNLNIGPVDKCQNCGVIGRDNFLFAGIYTEQIKAVNVPGFASQEEIIRIKREFMGR